MKQIGFRSNDMEKFYDGSKPFDLWTVTSITKVRRSLGKFYMTFEALAFISAIFFSGVCCGIAITILYKIAGER